MKYRNNRNLSVAAIAALWASKVAVVTKALHYGRAAHRDERDGFTYAAAMEWRHAAELFHSNTLAADYFWRQWERVMRLPRRLAEPITDFRPGVLQLEPMFATPPTMEAGVNQILLPATA